MCTKALVPQGLCRERDKATGAAGTYGSSVGRGKVPASPQGNRMRQGVGGEREEQILLMQILGTLWGESRVTTRSSSDLAMRTVSDALGGFLASPPAGTPAEIIELLTPAPQHQWGQSTAPMGDPIDPTAHAKRKT